MKTVKVTIDGKEIQTSLDRTILQVARENNIYIPTMCYLTKVEPIGACRLCVVEVEGLDGMVLSCQEKVVDGAVIQTNSKALQEERQNIMKLYALNHPLECGVCVKSGECDLQNKTSEFEVNEQSFSLRDIKRKVENWGVISYDSSLCILCEKCVKVCNEIVGKGQLKVEPGGYKAIIVNTKLEDSCIDCGECMAVCPVGALAVNDFKYTTNPWELKKVPSTCTFCSSGCELSYEVKQIGIENSKEKIYRVTNNYEYSSLCGAGRFGFDYENLVTKKDEDEFLNAIEAFKKAEVIKFSSLITNEEALLLKKIAKRVDAKLVCSDAFGFSKFLRAFKKARGKSLWNSTQKKLSQSDAIVVFGSRIKDDAPVVKNHIAMATKRKKAKVVYMHPIEDFAISNLVTKFIKYEPGSEEAMALMLLQVFANKEEMTQDLQDFVDDIDIGFLSGESSISEEEIDELKEEFWKKKRFTLVVGADVFNHPEVENIAKILAAIERYTDFELLVIPPNGNSLGVSLICDLVEKHEGFSVGYNAPADYVLSALGDGDLGMPALNQQEGTFVTLDKRVVPLNAGLEYKGFILNDIANSLGVGSTHTIDFTKELPVDKGFRSIEFDSLEVKFSVDGDDLRGYELETILCDSQIELSEPDELPSYDGTVIYIVNPASNPNPFTNRAKLTSSEAKLIGTKQFASAAKISDGDVVEFEVCGNYISRVFKIDDTLKGTFALNPTFDMGLKAFDLPIYRFSKVKIKKRG